MLEVFTRTTGHNKKAICQSMKGTGPTKTRAIYSEVSLCFLWEDIDISKSITCGPA